MRRIGLLFIVVVITGMSGCSHVTPGVSSTSFSSDAMEVVGPAKGESTDTQILCLIPWGDSASVVSATEAAIESVKANALINTVVDDERGIGFLGLWCWQTIRVYGTAVKFKSQVISKRGRDVDNQSDGMIKNMEKMLLGR